jgi:nitroreductase
MDALEALHTRSSSPRLGGDPPAPAMLEKIFQAALRAPDHALLRPWRFLTIEGDARLKLGDLFAQAATLKDPEAAEAAVEKARGKPLRAPLIVVIIAKPTEHPSVPAIEQVISAGTAAHGMLVAAHSLGVGAMWRTGGMAYHPHVMAGLGLGIDEQIVGFLYMGEIQGRARNVPELPVSDYFQAWS